MSLSAKALYAVQKAALEDEEIGPLAIAEARTQCPGKRNVLYWQKLRIPGYTMS